jgi:hypothetical protein
VFRVARRAAATLLLAFAFIALASAVASDAAAADAPTPAPGVVQPIVTFRGPGLSTDGTPDTPLHNGITVVVDCSSGTCLLTMGADTQAPDGSSYSLSGTSPLVLVKGHGAYDLPSSGNLCGNGAFLGPSHLVVDLVGTGLHITQSFAPVSESCADDSGGSYALDAALISGTPCVLDGSCPTATPTPEPTATAAPGTTLHRPTHLTPNPPANAPSVLSALPTAATAFTLANLLWAAGGTVVLVLLIAFPSYLLDSASEKGLERFDAWRARRRPAKATPTAAAAAGAEAPVELAGIAGISWRTLPLALLGVLAASLISSFIDPGFGFSVAGLRVFLSFFASFLFDAVAAWFLLIWFVRRTDPGAAASFRFAPASLVVVAIAVLFTRLTGFQPGIVFGLVAGVAFGSVLADTVKARVALIGLGYSFVLGLAGWFGYSAIAGASAAHPSAIVVFLEELLAAMAVGGIAALPISLIPLRGLLGGEIFAWRKGVWAAAYALGLLAFFVVLMPKPFSWATVGISVWAWGILFAAYAIVAVVLWLVLAKPWRREDGGHGAETIETVEA